LVDNAIDEAEEAGVAPKVEVSVDTMKREIAVVDHGRGIPPPTVKALVDLSMKVSSRAAYVSPTRGQQGNALQTILAMPCALDRDKPGFAVIEAKGVAHRIAFVVDPLRDIPKPHYEREASVVRNGTRVTLAWPERACSLLSGSRGRFLQAAYAFAAFNPHLDLTVTWDGDRLYRFPPTASSSWKRWLPTDPTSPHWYDVGRLRRLMAAVIVDTEDRKERPPTVREFVAEFHSLSSTAKGAAVLDAVGGQGVLLRDLHADPERVNALLIEMRVYSEPVKPRRLGAVGAGHLRMWAEFHGADLDTFEYKWKAFEHDGLPYVAEAAFAYAPKKTVRHDMTAINFSPAVGGRPFGRLDGVLGGQHLGSDSPAVVFIHLVSPRLDFTDKGKSRLEVQPAVNSQMQSLLVGVTERWRKQREREYRDHTAVMRRAEALDREARRHRLTQKQAAFQVMEEAYLKASANGTLPANARQIFYVARPLIAALMGATITSQYFTQDLLPAYLREEEPDWSPAYDARGHFTEPHTNRSSGLGTLDVEDYVDKIAKPKIGPSRLATARVLTHGPEGRFSGVLFIEKEGFMALMEEAEIAERFDLLITSSKGFSVTAARRLIDVLCGEHRLPLYVLHDFDREGFGIAKTLVSDSPRYEFENESIKVHDLGFRLGDVRGLENEEAPISRSYEALRRRLRINGATEAEIAYLLDGPIKINDEGVRVIETGKRVELNAMTSDVFVAFVERKLTEAGARKVVPGKALLDLTYRAFAREKIARPEVEALIRRLNTQPVVIPPDLGARVRDHLDMNPAETWDKAVRKIVGIEDLDEDEEG
jgi:DNA topoisomerase VI subunit B